MLDFDMNFIAPKPIIQRPEMMGFGALWFIQISKFTSRLYPSYNLQTIILQFIPNLNLECGGHLANVADTNRKSRIDEMMNTANRQYCLHNRV